MFRTAIVLTGLLVAAAGRVMRQTPNTVPDGFTFAAGGDMIGPYHTLQGVDDRPFFSGVVPLFKNADLGFANQEGSIFDLKTFQGSPAAENGGGIPLSPLAVASDLKAMGITMVSKANNHATDWGTEGLVVTQQSLTAAGIAFAGSGMSEVQARGPGYVETSKGKAALVSTASTFTRMSIAGAPGTRRGEPTHARPGISALHVEEIQLRPADQIATLRRIMYGGNGETHAKAGNSNRDEVEVGGQIFRASVTGNTTWEMSTTDEAAILNSVREARQNATFVLFAIHAHETGGPLEDPFPGRLVDPTDRRAQSVSERSATPPNSRAGPVPRSHRCRCGRRDPHRSALAERHRDLQGQADLL